MTLGAFRLAVGSERLAYRVIEAGVRLRSEPLGFPYGDQGFFLRRERFSALGGFPNGPMEDLRLVRAVRKRRGKIAVVPLRLVTSARRWEKVGIARTTLRNWMLLLLDILNIGSIRNRSAIQPLRPLQSAQPQHGESR